MSERIWLYPISKTLSKEQLNSLKENCLAFVNSWAAHDQQLNASFEIYKNRILIFKVDESVYNASGCSIDKLTHLIQSLEKTFSIELLNRFLVAYDDKDSVRAVHSSKIKELLESGAIDKNTIVFDNTISSSEQLNEWRKPLNQTWLCKYLPAVSS